MSVYVCVIFVIVHVHPLQKARSICGPDLKVVLHKSKEKGILTLTLRHSRHGRVKSALQQLIFLLQLLILSQGLRKSAVDVTLVGQLLDTSLQRVDMILCPLANGPLCSDYVVSILATKFV
jgi:hypothetical protein